MALVSRTYTGLSLVRGQCAVFPAGLALRTLPQRYWTNPSNPTHLFRHALKKIPLEIDGLIMVISCCSRPIVTSPSPDLTRRVSLTLLSILTGLTDRLFLVVIFFGFDLH